MNFKRDLYWLVAALLFGVLALPFLVYYTGVATLGPYSNGGPFDFFWNFFADLARFRRAAWALALGPLVITLFWRILLRVFLPRRTLSTHHDSAT